VIFLIGYRGCGKSTVGRELADRLGWTFLDADSVLEAVAGQTIAAIFATEGETAFRDRETAVLRELAKKPQHVIATGGGVVLRAENRERLMASGFVAWLDATPELVWPRIQTDPLTAERRPTLTTGGFREVVELMAAREPLYRMTAHARFDAAASPDVTANAILVAWSGFTTSPSSSGASGSSFSG